jgi:DNA-binding IclR family transcriptional regulator
MQFLSGRRNESKKGRINTQSIADSTGIPRESVRRKVARLMDRGWVRRNEDGTFEVTERAAADLAPATEATFDYLLGVGRIIVAMVNDANSREAGHPAPRENGANAD